MFPILPVLILLLLGPANAERLAVEGRLPATLLAVHRAMAPVAVVATVEEAEVPETAVPANKRTARVRKTTEFAEDHRLAKGVDWSCPTRAGPAIA